MATIRRYITAKAPLDRIWDVLADPFSMPAWRAGVGELRRLTDNAVGVGFRFSWPVRLAGRKRACEEEITAFWPGVMIALRGEAPGVDLVTTIRLLETPQGTGIEYCVDWNATSAWTRFLAPFLRARAGAAAERSLHRLRDLCRESDAPSAPSLPPEGAA